MFRLLVAVTVRGRLPCFKDIHFIYIITPGYESQSPCDLPCSCVGRERQPGAERLMMSQPAVSKQIRLLEKSLGHVLLDRLPRGVRLTAAGRVLADYATRIFSLEHEAREALDDLKGLRRGRLRVGASTTIGVHMLPELLVRFRRLHPRIGVSLQIVSSREVGRRLLRGALGLGLTESAIEHPKLETRSFYIDRLVPIASPQHPLARKRRLTAAQLCREAFIVHEAAAGGGESLAERALAGLGLRLVNPVLSLPSTEAIKRAVMAGVGVAVVSRQAIGLELEARRLVVLSVYGLKVERPMYVVRARSREPSPAAVAFEALLREEISRFT
jgi:DNA-binding transcriptional LysR family regulator